MEEAQHPAEPATCEHPFRRWRPHPPRGARCPQCGEPVFRDLDMVIDGQHRALSDEDYELLRAYAEIWAWDLEYTYRDDTGESDITAERRAREIRRIIEQMGWDT